MALGDEGPTETTPEPDGQPHGPQRDAAPPGMPRWVKVLATAFAGLLLLAVLLQVTGVGGDHGPGRHSPGFLGAATGPPVKR